MNPEIRTLDVLVAENLALKRAAAVQTLSGQDNRASLYVWAVVGLCVAAALTIFGIYVVRPDRDNTALIGMLMGGVFGPCIAGFLAVALREVHVAFNGRMTELLLLTATASKAQGQLEEQAKSASVESRLGPQRDAIQATGEDTNTRVQVLEAHAKDSA